MTKAIFEGVEYEAQVEEGLVLLRTATTAFVVELSRAEILTKKEEKCRNTDETKAPTSKKN